MIMTKDKEWCWKWVQAGMYYLCPKRKRYKFKDLNDFSWQRLNLFDSKKECLEACKKSNGEILVPTWHSTWVAVNEGRKVLGLPYVTHNEWYRYIEEARKAFFNNDPLPPLPHPIEKEDYDGQSRCNN